MGSNTTRRRMTRPQRRAQLITIGRAVFAARGMESAAMEEIAAAAGVSKPVVYEHFGSKENLYKAVVEEEKAALEDAITSAISLGRSRVRIEQAVLAILTYVEENPEGFTILARDPGASGGYATLLGNATESVSPILGAAFERAGFDRRFAVLYANSLVGMVSQTAQWWMERRDQLAELDKETVAAHIVNLCWNGLAGMESDPKLLDEVDGPIAAQGARLGAGEEADPAHGVR